MNFNRSDDPVPRPQGQFGYEASFQLLLLQLSSLLQWLIRLPVDRNQIWYNATTSPRMGSYYRDDSVRTRCSAVYRLPLSVAWVNYCAGSRPGAAAGPRECNRRATQTRPGDSVGNPVCCVGSRPEFHLLFASFISVVGRIFGRCDSLHGVCSCQDPTATVGGLDLNFQVFRKFEGKNTVVDTGTSFHHLTVCPASCSPTSS